jgi:hypothetical protein
MALQPFVGPWHFLQFHNLFYRDGRTPWTSNQPVAMPLPKLRTTQTQNKRTQTSIPWVGFEPTISAYERAKTVHALDRAAAVIEAYITLALKFESWILLLIRSYPSSLICGISPVWSLTLSNSTLNRNINDPRATPLIKSRVLYEWDGWNSFRVRKKHCHVVLFLSLRAIERGFVLRHRTWLQK